MEDFDRSFLFGIVFDVANPLHLNAIKEDLVKYLVDSGMSTRMYVSHPDWNKIPRDQGESVYYVVSYKEPTNFSIETAFKTAVALVGEQNEDCEKYVLLITDRFQAPINYRYRKGFLSNTIHGYTSKIIAFGLSNCDSLILQSIVKENDAQFVNLEDPSKIGSELSKILGK
jgi:hypothetical protein